MRTVILMAGVLVNKISIVAVAGDRVDGSGRDMLAVALGLSGTGEDCGLAHPARNKSVQNPKRKTGWKRKDINLSILS
jgi:hypothetical protein